ncbi:MAG: hypothetical protein QXD36_03490 [Sulfolobales archaeon]
MMNNALSREEKLRFLKALEEDLEFRYATAGALGILELLRRLDSIESRVEEYSKILSEHSRRLEELSKRIEELMKRVEEYSKILSEHSRRLEELSKTLSEVVLTLREHEVKIDELGRKVSNLEITIGALTESTYARYFYEDLERSLSLRGERVVRRVRNARIDETDVDLLVETDRIIYVVEIKIKPKHEDIGVLIAKLDLIKKFQPEREVVGVLAGTLVGKEIEAYAREKGVLVYRY